MRGACLRRAPLSQNGAVSEMKVRELRALLEQCDQNGDVYVVTQELGAAETLLAGVVTRAEVAAADDRDARGDDGLPQGDVFLCEGHYVRFARVGALTRALRAKLHI